MPIIFRLGSNNLFLCALEGVPSSIRSYNTTSKPFLQPTDICLTALLGNPENNSIVSDKLLGSVCMD
jgi:hypothetical protein